MYFLQQTKIFLGDAVLQTMIDDLKEREQELSKKNRLASLFIESLIKTHKRSKTNDKQTCRHFFLLKCFFMQPIYSIIYCVCTPSGQTVLFPGCCSSCFNIFNSLSINDFYGFIFTFMFGFDSSSFIILLSENIISYFEITTYLNYL